MANRQRNHSTKQTVVDPAKFGVSLSIKQCRNFGLTPQETINFLLKEVGIRRFRLMSYWDEIEAVKGAYNFTQLDSQINQIEKAGGIITLCLGVRQPRWPESHWPQWTRKLEQSQKYVALYASISTIVERYKSNRAIVSWQLENEALNRNFGLHGDFNRARLSAEYELVRSLDQARPIIISTSNTWGAPLRKPRPTLFGFTFYKVQFKHGRYSKSKLPWWWYNLRAFKVALLTGRKSFIHELQAEPWGPKAIWEMSKAEQAKSMDTSQLKSIIQEATKTGLFPIDLWGGEWWYWRHKQGDKSIADTVKLYLSS